MKRLKQWVSGLLMVGAAACSSGSDRAAQGGSEVVGEAKQALTVPGAIPVPCVPCWSVSTTEGICNGKNYSDTIPIWDGSQVQLMLADAYAQCGSAVDQGPGFDSVLDEVALKMYFTVYEGLGVPTNIPAAWLALRANANRNCEVAGDGQARAFPLTKRDGVMWRSSWGNGTSETDAAHYDLRLGDLNLCIAQQLREASPGASGGAALLLSADEQVELLQLIKERAQIAMLQYATLLGLSRGASTRAWTRFNEIDDVLNGLPEVERSKFGARFASSVQLSIQLNQELASLLARSRSAHLPYRAADNQAPQTEAEWIWGPGSWQQRLAGSLFGADPGSDPKDGSRREFDYSTFPYLKSQPPRPQAGELLRLARSLDLVDLKVKPGASYFGSCNATLDANDPLIYKEVQLYLQREACPSPTSFVEATGKCNGADAVDILGQRFGITSADGAALTQQLADALSPGVGIESSQSCGSHERWGAVNFRGQLSAIPATGEPTKIHLSADFDFVPRDIVDHASLFSTVDGKSLSGEAPNVPTARTDDLGPPQQGLTMVQGMYFNINQWLPSGYTTEQKRLAGGIDALVATRRVLQVLDDFPPPDQKRWGKMQIQPLVNLIDAAVGPTGMVLRMRSNRAGYSPNDPNYWGNPPTDLDVELTGAADDAVFAAPANAGDFIRLYAIPDGDGWAQHKANDATTTIYGKKLVDALSVPSRKVDLWWNADENAWMTGQADIPYWIANGSSTSNRYSNNRVKLSNLGPSILVAVRVKQGQDANFSSRGANTLTDQQLLAQSRLVATRVNGYLEFVPVASKQVALAVSNGIYIGTGGTLGTLARRQLTPSLVNPGQVAYDGFGLPEGWVPPFAAELFGGSPGESSVTHFMTSAKTASSAATQAVDDAMKTLLAQEADLTEARISSEQRDAAIKAAQDHQKEALHQAQASLCGESNKTCAIKVIPLPLLDMWYPGLEGQPTCADAKTLALPVLKEAVDIVNGTLPSPDDQDYYNWLDGHNAKSQQLYEALNDPIAEDFILPASNWALNVIGERFGRTDFNSEQTRLNTANDNSALAIAAMRCSAARVIKEFMALRPSIALDVIPTLTSGTAPTFETYAGGSLQSALIEQWRAIKAPDERFRVLIKTLDAADARIRASNAVLAKAGGDVVRECSASAMASAYAAGHSGGFPLGISWSPGPLIAQQARCKDVTAAFEPAIKEATAQNQDAMSAVTSATQGLVDAQAAIAQSAAAIEKLSNDALLAKSNADTEEAVAVSLANANNQVVSETSFGLSRRLYDADLWRAKALVETARRDALAARRAIEAQFVVDMSQLGGDEAFVVAPRTWANEIYRYDLSLPSSVGLVVSNGASADTSNGGIIAKSAVEDYVTNLESFVNGYAATRPSAIARDEIDVVTLPGLAPGAATTVDINNASGTKVSTAAIYPAQGTWQGHCPEKAATAGDPTGWVAISNGADFTAKVQPDGTTKPGVCGSSRPDAARISFLLSPWGQLDGDPRNIKFAARYNARWQKLAVNLVGTGVVDCADALDVYDCYSRGSINYNLTHQGNPWVTDYYGAWHTMALPPGLIEGGKALALERWLEPLVDGWSTPYISAIARTEFEFRPLGGEYTLELKLPPEARPEYIERIQILVGSQSWVAQSLGAQ